MRHMRLPLVFLALAMAGTMGTAHAGRSCEKRAITVASLERGLGLAQKTATALDASGARVVLLARAGQDLSKYRLRWSHLGLAYRSQDAQGQDAWRVVHKLNACGTAEAAIYRQGLGEFFMDDPWRYEAAWVIPTPEVQDKLTALLADPVRTTALHRKPYSIVSYAWGQKYQQSNQWAIETLAAAMEPSIADVPDATTRAQRAQAWLQFKGYQPTALNIGPLTRMGGRMTAANVAFDDHPNEKRYADRIETVTVDSVFSWMQSSGVGGVAHRLDCAEIACVPRSR